MKKLKKFDDYLNKRLSSKEIDKINRDVEKDYSKKCLTSKVLKEVVDIERKRVKRKADGNRVKEFFKEYEESKANTNMKKLKKAFDKKASKKVTRTTNDMSKLKKDKKNSPGNKSKSKVKDKESKFTTKRKKEDKTEKPFSINEMQTYLHDWIDSHARDRDEEDSPLYFILKSWPEGALVAKNVTLNVHKTLVSGAFTSSENVQVEHYSVLVFLHWEDANDISQYTHEWDPWWVQMFVNSVKWIYVHRPQDIPYVLEAIGR